MIKKWIFIILVLVFALGGFNFVLSQTEEIQIHFFYSAICPHCAEEKEFLYTLKTKYPEISIKEYEVIYNQENQKILKDFYEKYQVPEGNRGWVPVTFTSAKYFIGFSEQIAKDLENCIKECLVNEEARSQTIKVPILGEIDLSKMSLFTLTLIFGALDGLNPCAMWILLFLLSLLINTRSRKRVLLVGGTFILASGIIYFLILAGWLKLFLAISYVNLTRILIGVFALVLGSWQIRTFIRYKGVCPIAKGDAFKGKIRNGLIEEAKKIVSSSLTPAILIGTILLALGINLVEFFCSAGLPAIYTRILTLNALDSLNYYFYLLLYTIMFILDDFIIFSIAVTTLTRWGFTDKYNYWATLIGGLLILALGILLIFKPEILMFA